VSVNEEYRGRLRAAEADGRITSMSGLGKMAFSHAMEHGQLATEALLRGNGNGAQAVDNPQVGRIEDLLTEHQHGREVAWQTESRGCVEVCLKMVAAFALLSVVLSATAVYLVGRQAATA
jgi:hypothetical protein